MSRANRSWGVATVLAVVAAGFGGARPTDAVACGNDRDAKPMEEHFPDVEATIVGRVRRHSREWMEWRVGDRTRRLAPLLGSESIPAGPRSPQGRLPEATLRDLDDLGVAYDRLGRADDAIAVGRRALAEDGDRYESLMNLGTYLCHANRAQEGLPFLRAALRAYPNAHFGRADVQIAAVEYVESFRRDGVVPLPLVDPDHALSVPGFALFAAGKDLEPGATVVPPARDERERLRKGIVGILYDTRTDDPVLLEMLAHTLVDPARAWTPDAEARDLAAKAYLRAAAGVGAEAASRYRVAAERALDPDGHETRSRARELADVERSLTVAVAVAARRADTLRAIEQRFLASSPDPEEAFQKFLRTGASPYRPGSTPKESAESVPARERALTPAPAVASGERVSGSTIRMPQCSTSCTSGLGVAAALLAGAGGLAWMMGRAFRERRPVRRGATRRALVRRRAMG